MYQGIFRPEPCPVQPNPKRGVGTSVTHRSERIVPPLERVALTAYRGRGSVRIGAQNPYGQPSGGEWTLLGCGLGACVCEHGMCVVVCARAPGDVVTYLHRVSPAGLSWPTPGLGR